MHRLLSAVLVFAFAGGQMAVTTHAAESIHQRCAEHGEVIDASIAPPVEEGARIVPVTPAAHDEHCLLAAALGNKANRSSDDSFSVAAPTAAIGSGSADGSAGRPIAVFRYAPKTSPPRR